MSANEPTSNEYNLCCTYCGSGLLVTTEYSGDCYGGSDVPASLECNGEVSCGAVWETDGTLRTPARYVTYPETYTRSQDRAAY